jgi:hypothetical protein
MVATINLPENDPNKKTPGTETDLHSMAVLIYQYLFKRHPLEGMKFFPNLSTEEIELLTRGKEALFIENPNDKSNPPEAPISIPYTSLGSKVTELFNLAFIEGLHDSIKRPKASKWLNGLLWTFDNLTNCENSSCEWKWFVVEGKKITCPCCGTKISKPLVRLNLFKQNKNKPGNWDKYYEIIAHHEKAIYDYHAYDDISNDGTAKEYVAYTIFQNGQWLLVNHRQGSLTNSIGQTVPQNGYFPLSDGDSFMFSRAANGVKAIVEFV